jgi:hypothetical protein
MESMAVVAAIACLVRDRGKRRWASLALGTIFVLLVGVSRIYLGVHLMIDIPLARSARSNDSMAKVVEASNEAAGS